MDKQSNTLRVGILGCGSIARQRHAYEYSHRDDVEIAGFFDPRRDRAEAMVQDFGGKIYTSADELISDPAIDAVSVCVANSAHAELTIRALNEGKHVLCEKPMATTLEECRAMLEAAEKNGKRLMLGHNQRLAQAHVKAKQILDSGELGRVITFSSTFGHKGPEMWSADKSANTWFFKKGLAALGAMADLGIHKVDLICFLVGKRVESVTAEMAVLHKTFPDGTPIEVEDNSMAVLRFEKGTMGTITSSWTHYGEECNATILYCEKGIMKIYHDPVYALEIIFADQTKVFYELNRMQTNDDKQQAESGVIKTFVEALKSGQPSVLDAESIIHSMEVSFACLESAQTGRRIDLQSC